MKENVNLKIKSENGFTMQDLLVACFIFILFAGLIGTLMYRVYETNIRASLTSQMCMYAVQILEDIDKISYEDAQSKTGADYKEQFSIPEGFNVELQFTDYGADKAYIEDIIKIVDLKISYTVANQTEEFTVRRLKIKEI